VELDILPFVIFTVISNRFGERRGIHSVFGLLSFWIEELSSGTGWVPIPVCFSLFLLSFQFNQGLPVSFTISTIFGFLVLHQYPTKRIP